MALLHMKHGGGRYDDPNTWREARVPTPDDEITCDIAVVEIDAGSWQHSAKDYERFWQTPNGSSDDVQ